MADDLAIIEHVAAVLLRIRELVPSDRHGPPAQPLNGPAPQEYESSELGQSARSQINRLIREAAGNSPQEAAEVLDPGALFRLPRLASGGQYPTPRHVVQLMHRLCKVDRGHALLDLACGSGGFLAYRAGGPGPVGPTVGVEIAQRWARIAYANALLRIGPAGVTVLNKNAVSAFGPAVQPGTFDRVLMNPPFGETVDADVLGAAAVPDVAGTSEVVLATLALEALAQNGRAGVLFPAGPLFGSGTAETALRRRLLTSTDGVVPSVNDCPGAFCGS